MQRSFFVRSFSAFTRGVLAAALILLVLSFLEKANARPVYPDEIQALRAKQFNDVLGDTRDAEALRELYLANNYAPIWHNSDRAIERRHDLQAALDTIAFDGLNQERYPVLEFDPTENNSNLSRDIETSRSFLRLIGDLSNGLTSPSELGIEWDINVEKQSTIVLAKQLLVADNIATALDTIRPAHRHYQTLRAALQHYRQIAAHGGWTKIPEDTLLKPGAISERVTLLRNRLTAELGTPYLQTSAVPELYGEELEAAVTALQRRHGLDPDGVVGRRTVAALNVPVEQRIEQIALNLERWRWLPQKLGDRHILVNTAEFTLALYENDKSMLDMRVVVGKAERQTPIVSKSMKYLVLNPTWTVPPKILHDDILPKLREQPDYLQSKGMRIYAGWSADAAVLAEDQVDWSRVSERNSPYKVQQAPGANNALGQIKFMFPNQHSVYIHDTPARSLFSARVRAFSSGCVRVEHPMVLAKALLSSSQRWQDDAVRQTLESGETTSVILPQAVPVHLVYLTAWVSDSGELHFRDDIYKRDRQLQLALLGTPERHKNS